MAYLLCCHALQHSKQTACLLCCCTLQLMYTEPYDLDGCAAFVADFLAFEPLEDPLHPPEFLPSPTNTLLWQAGDSFDLSVVLCSLLLGVGYNSYVVVGYAPQVRAMAGGPQCLAAHSLCTPGHHC
jgi:hypothetical protein